MALPYLEVSHLASSTSFYASILQPLGLRFLATDREQTSSVGTVTYGLPAAALQRQGQSEGDPLPVLQIREATHPFEPLKLSFIVLAAPSPTAIAEFHDCALSANPWLRLQAEGNGFPGHPSGPDPRHRLGIEGGVSPGRATVQDLDGNTIQILCSPPSRREDLGRVLDWQFDTAQSTHSRTRSQSHPLPSSASSSTSSHAQSQAPFRARPSPRSGHPGYGSIVPAAMSQRAPSHVPDDQDPFAEPSISPRQSPNNVGLSTSSVVGALLGVAAVAGAGAAFTYNMINREKERKPRHDLEPPTLSRRSTCPEKAPSSHKSRHDDHEPNYHGHHTKSLAYRPAGGYERQALPAPMPYPEDNPWTRRDEEYPPRRPPYPDEYPSRSLSFPDDYTPRKMPYDDDEDSDEPPPHDQPRRPVQYLTEEPHFSSGRSTAARSTAARSTVARSSAAKSTARSTAKSTTKSTAKNTARSTTKSVAKSRAPSRVPDEIEEAHSRQSSRHSSRASTVRSRSEAPLTRSSLVVADADHRSHGRSRHSGAPKSTHSRARSQRPHRDPERDSYFSARSHRSSGTARRPPPPEVETEIMEAPEVPEVPDVPEFPGFQHVQDFEEFQDYGGYEDYPRGPELVIRSRDGSRFSVTRLSNGGEPPIIMGHSNRTPSHMSARNIALPMSGVGSSHADWDDDMVSIAPSDSISCIGSKSSRRSRRVR
ncbi:hypothetical protein AK830_g6399 [Neonectria ditissima]|uniref:Uncharacterized protein n=1 Tax=Neonectria ditissima TaxID=78410 RepID=A0A0P7BJG0_9HYPO|nr:hypothetical protein AK830_g6399 [Neonectria ditissima]